MLRVLMQPVNTLWHSLPVSFPMPAILACLHSVRDKVLGHA